MGLLRADAFGAFEQCVQTGDGRGAVAADGRQLAPDFAQDDAEDGALPFDGTPQAKELPGVRRAAGLAAQFPTFLDEGLFQSEAHLLGTLHDLGPGDLQQAAVDRRRARLFLHGRIHDDPLELGWAHGLGLDGGVDGRLEQFFDAGFADGGTKATDLGGIARQLRGVVVQTAEVLPDDILGPAGNEFFVTEVEGVFEVEQCGHEPNRQAGTAG